MTGLDMTFSSRPSRSGIASPVNSDFGANMVDERIRDEIRRFREDMADAVGADYDGMSGTEDSDGFGSDEDGEEIDEIEMQRLTRERGFGLGRWIDRLVEWTLFGVEDLPAPSVQRQVVSARASRIVSPAQSRRGSRAVSVVEGGSEGNEGEEEGSDADTDITITREYDVPGIMEPPSETAGGWDDAWWLFSVMRKSLL